MLYYFFFTSFFLFTWIKLSIYGKQIIQKLLLQKRQPTIRYARKAETIIASLKKIASGVLLKPFNRWRSLGLILKF